MHYFKVKAQFPRVREFASLSSRPEICCSNLTAASNAGEIPSTFTHKIWENTEETQKNCIQ